MHPVARKDEILTTEVPGGDIVLYDLRQHRYQQLNPTCACVWSNCDGATSVERLTAMVEERFACQESGAVVELALEELRDKDLLVSPAPSVPGLSRRDALRRLMVRGVAVAMVPLVTSLVLPRRAEAHGGGAMGSPRSDDSLSRSSDESN